MSAKDVFHQAVRSALEKDGWKITHDPLSIKIDGLEFRIDLGAQRVLTAQKQGQKIAIEVKSFVSRSELSDFHGALGQTLNYRSALRKKMPDRMLYLAVPLRVYRSLFSIQFIQEIVSEHQLKLLVFDSIQEEIVLWKE
ncbi:MAG: XisH family protein [Geitlerinemataceae cyanobacterium]